MRETHRFQTLVSYFTNPTEFQIEFMVACMQFINIVVHSVEVSIHYTIYILLFNFRCQNFGQWDQLSVVGDRKRELFLSQLFMLDMDHGVLVSFLLFEHARIPVKTRIVFLTKIAITPLVHIFFSLSYLYIICKNLMTLVNMIFYCFYEKYLFYQIFYKYWYFWI